MALILLMAVLLGFNHWLMEPLLRLSSAVLELSAAPWLLLAAFIWLLAGSQAQRP